MDVPSLREIEEWPAVSHLRNYGFKPQHLTPEDIILLKDEPGVQIWLWHKGSGRRSGGLVLPPKDMSDPVSVRVTSDAHRDQNALSLRFKSVKDLTWSLSSWAAGD